MIGKVIGALRQEHGQGIAKDDRDQHRRSRGVSLDEARLDSDLGLPRRRGGEAQSDRRRNQVRGSYRGEMRIEAEDRKILGLESQTQASFSLIRADLPERLRR